MNNPSPMWKAIKYILVYFGFQLALIILLMIPAYFLKVDVTTVSLYALAIAAVLAIWYVIRKGEVKINKESFSIRPWTILLPCVVALFFYYLPEGWMNETLSLPNVVGEELDEMATSLFGLLFIGVIGPVAEELVFRGAVLNSLLGWKKTEGKPWLAVLLSAVLFSLYHVNPAQIPNAFILGLFFGWLCYRTGSLMPGIALHVLNNSLGCIASLFPDEPGGPETIAELFGSPRLEFYAVYLSAFLCAAVVVQAVLMVKKHYPPR